MLELLLAPFLDMLVCLPLMQSTQVLKSAKFRVLSTPSFPNLLILSMEIVGFPLQLLFYPSFLHTNMFKGNPIQRKVHRIVKYLKLKWMNPSIKLRELVLDKVKFRNKALLKETLIIDGLEQNLTKSRIKIVKMQVNKIDSSR